MSLFLLAKIPQKRHNRNAGFILRSRKKGSNPMTACRKGIAILLAYIFVFAALPAIAEEKEALYNAIITYNFASSYTNVYAEMDQDSEVYTQYYAGRSLKITAVYPNWVEIQYRDGVAYILRHRVDHVTPIDKASTPPYGVWVNTLYAEADDDIYIYSEKSEDSSLLDVITRGGKVSFIGVEDGWGVVVYKRQYGYVNTSRLKELKRVSPDAETETDPNVPIAVYTSFYSDNVTRINNLAVCCLRLNRVMKPRDELNFNQSVGPFNIANGYLPAPVLIDGETKMGYGGGSCQVSSTIYNTILQLPGITVTERHPHGSNGAPYLPHGTDASSGDLNFRFRNDYPFSIRIEGSIHDLALFIAIYKEVE